MRAFIRKRYIFRPGGGRYTVFSSPSPGYASRGRAVLYKAVKSPLSLRQRIAVSSLMRKVISFWPSFLLLCDRYTYQILRF